MKRAAARWRDCSPHVMSCEMSIAATKFAFEDARHDILRMAELLRMAAYPRRGTEEDSMSIEDFAGLVQKSFTLEDIDT